MWTGQQLIIWGGYDGSQSHSDGGLYNPAANTWTAPANFPSPRYLHTAVWTGRQMLVSGGANNSATYLGDNHAYTPATAWYLYVKP